MERAAQSGESEEKALDPGAHGALARPAQTRTLVARPSTVLARIKT
jgi:hypothetical protein